MSKIETPPIHPGEILVYEWLVPMAISDRELTYNEKELLFSIAIEQQNITPEIAEFLAQKFYTTPQFWLKLQDKYNSEIAKDNNESM